MKVFVYGTLKSKYGNNYLLRGARDLGVHIVSGVRLWYSYGPGSFPVAELTDNPEHRTIGEVYDLTPDPTIINNLDALEGVPHMYRRELIVTESRKAANIYIGNRWNFQELNPVPTQDGIFNWTRN